MKTVTFCGHRDAAVGEKVRRWLYDTVEGLIRNGAERFYFGGCGHFDSMAAGTVWELKKKYPQIRLILVLAYLNAKPDMKYYDETIYPPLETVPPRYAISKRNRWMVQEADTVIAYVLHGWGGAAQTLGYAQNMKKQIFLYTDSSAGQDSASLRSPL